MPRTPTVRAQFVQAREPATFTFEDEDVVLGLSDVFAADHPWVRAHPSLFKPLAESRQRPAVEQMTAAPGEQRG